MDVCDLEDEFERSKILSTKKTELQSFYSNKTILITGGSGFIGMLLIEKLLRSCTDLNKIILLLREKKGKSPYVRVKEIFRNEVFNKMKQIHPNFWKKIELLIGCCEEDMLGLQEKQIQKLQSEVNIIFHAAATVRFEDHIRDEYNINVKGTKSLLNIAEGIKNLEAFIYVSTLYCQSHLPEIEEKIYPAPLPDEEVMILLKKLDNQTLTVLTPLILNGRFNSYVMTKAIAEELVGKYRHKIPVAICRPSVVTATDKEPLSCWINNIYGATGVFVGSGIGFLRTLYCNPNCKAEIIPADHVVNGLLAVPKYLQKHWYNFDKVEPVFNFVARSDNVMTWEQLMELMYTSTKIKEVKTDHMIWVFHLTLDQNRWIWLVKYYILHLLPTPFYILMEKLTKSKPKIWKGYIKLWQYTNQLSFFMLKSWKISRTNVDDLYKSLSTEDKILFKCDANIDWQRYFYYMPAGLARYVLDFDWDNKKKVKLAKRKYKM